MAHCIECNSKIAWFKRRSSVYCSAECEGEARARAVLGELQVLARIEAERDSQASIDRHSERIRLETEAENLLRKTSDIVRTADAAARPCPKCGSAWEEQQGMGSFGRNKGRCHRCGFQAEFIAILDCAHCQCHSLVVETDDEARCPRCKSRPRLGRQIA